MDVLTLTDLDRFLACGLLREPYVEMVQAGRHLSAGKFTTSRMVGAATSVPHADAGKISQQLASGATLLLRNVEHWHAPAADLVSRLGSELGRRVEAFFFLSPPEHQGLSVHRDDADVFVIQVQGRKDWTVHGTPTDGWWQPQPEKDPGATVLRTTLEPGDILYLPRAAAHSAVGTGDDLSAHLSLTVREIGTAHLYEAMLQLLEAELELPPRPLDDTGLEHVAHQLLTHHRARLRDLSPADLLSAARSATCLPPAHPSRLADSQSRSAAS
ncbi:cupin domain-containing protein [Streptomyces sp. NPDC046915]|uniref:JmjC domain-containing protein n=1 Tax=Streptomyces sp. NPDC046915 TaxID=3155257 RepID=UPI0033D973C2